MIAVKVKDTWPSAGNKLLDVSRMEMQNPVQSRNKDVNQQSRTRAC